MKKFKFTLKISYLPLWLSRLRTVSLPTYLFRYPYHLWYNECDFKVQNVPCANK